MARVLPRTRETLSAGGTTSVALGGAVSGAQAFSANASVGQRLAVWFEDGTAHQWGIWYLDGSGNLIQDRFLGSSTGSQLTLSASAEAYSADLPMGYSGLGHTAQNTVQAVVNKYTPFSDNWSGAYFNNLLYCIISHYPGPVDGVATGIRFRLRSSASAGSGAKIRWGIYELDANYTPTGQPIAETGDVSLELAPGYIVANFGAPVEGLFNRDLAVGYLWNTNAGATIHNCRRRYWTPFGVAGDTTNIATALRDGTNRVGWTTMPDADTAVWNAAPENADQAAFFTLLELQ